MRTATGPDADSPAFMPRSAVVKASVFASNCAVVLVPFSQFEISFWKFPSSAFVSWKGAFAVSDPANR